MCGDVLEYIWHISMHNNMGARWDVQAYVIYHDAYQNSGWDANLHRKLGARWDMQRHIGQHKVYQNIGACRGCANVRNIS